MAGLTVTRSQYKVPVNFHLLPAHAELRKSLHPRKEGMKHFAVKKAGPDGVEHWYVEGIASGPQMDAHGERMTEACVKDFSRQAQEKTILFVHPHSDDLVSHHIGKLAEVWEAPGGEWGVSMRLWDETDDVPADRIAAAKDFLNMTTGGGPYGKPVRISQFSVQGLVEKGDVVQNSDGTRDLNRVDLDAIAAVSRGAYPQEDFTTVEKIFKSYDQAVKKTTLDESLMENAIFRDYEEFQWAMSQTLRDIMDSDDPPESKKEQIKQAFEDLSVKLQSLFEQNNYTVPGENKMEQPTEEEQKQGIPTGEEPETVAEEDPKGMALADKISQMAESLGAFAQELMNREQMETGELEGAMKQGMEGEGEEEGEDMEKKKTVTPPDTEQPKDNIPEKDEEPNDTENVNKMRKMLKSMGLSDAQIKAQITAIKKQANPTNLILERQTELERQVTGLNKGLQTLLSHLGAFDVAKSSAPAPVQKGAQGYNAMTAAMRNAGLSAEQIAKALGSLEVNQPEALQQVSKNLYNPNTDPIAKSLGDVFAPGIRAVK